MLGVADEGQVGVQQQRDASLHHLGPRSAQRSGSASLAREVRGSESLDGAWAPDGAGSRPSGGRGQLAGHPLSRPGTRDVGRSGLTTERDPAHAQYRAKALRPAS